jgi:hypothetical protein
MKTTSPSATDKESRLIQALKLVSAIKGVQSTRIESKGGLLWGAMIVCDTRLIVNILECPACDVFCVHAPDWLPVTSTEVAYAIANRTHSILRVGKVLVRDGHLGIFAHEFIPKGGLASALNIQCLMGEVLMGIVVIIEQLKELENMSSRLRGLPHCPSPALN